MTTIDICVRRRIEVPDDAIKFNEYFQKQGIERINAVETARAFLNSDESLSSAYVTGTVVIGPSPEDLAEHASALEEYERAKQERDLKRVVGATDLPTDEELYDDNVGDEPELTAYCSECGSSDFQYYEDVGYYSDLHELDVKDGVVYMSFPGSKSSEGNGFPGLVCNSCDAMLDEDNIEMEWG